MVWNHTATVLSVFLSDRKLGRVRCLVASSADERLGCGAGRGGICDSILRDFQFGVFHP